MNLYLIDFETTFSKEHTLTKHSIEEYVRHPKFEVIGCGVKDLQTGAKLWWPSDQIQVRLKAYAKQGAFIAHHSQFDGFVLNHVYGIKPAYWYDTLSMARAIYPRLEKHSLEFLASYLHLGSPKTVPYNQFRGYTVAEIEARPDLLKAIGDGCLHDIELTHALFNILHPQMPQSELNLIDETVRLYTEPLLEGDQELLCEALKEAVIARETKMHKLGLTDNVLRSPSKFAALIRGAGLHESEIPTKVSLRTGKTTYAFAKSDIEFLNLREHEDSYIRDIVEARLAAQTSIHETRAGRLLSTAERGSIPIYLRYYGAHTGRFSGGDKSNFQNLPRGSKLRNALCAPRGYTLVWGDLSQIECRITAYLAGCETLLTAFEGGRDIYSEFGIEAFKKEVSKKVNPDLRFFSKETVLGCGFGMGGKKFYPYLESKIRNMENPIPMLDKIITDGLIVLFRRRYSEIPALWKELDTILDGMYNDPNYEKEFGPVTVIGRKVILPNGLFLDYTDMRYLRKGDMLTDKLVAKKSGYYMKAMSLWGGSFLENIVQALAGICLKEIWLDLKNEASCVLQVHDELVFCVPLRQEQSFRAKLEARMKVAPDWLPGIPLDCEVDSGPAYGKGAWREAA